MTEYMKVINFLLKQNNQRAKLFLKLLYDYILGSTEHPHKTKILSQRKTNSNRTHS